METIDHKIPATTFDRDTMLNGMVAGDLSVASGTYVMMNGTVTGNLIAHEGSSVDVNGTVAGAVVNQGGHVKVRGVVGSVRDTGLEKTYVDPAAIVRSA